MDKYRVAPMKLCHVPAEYREQAKEHISRGIALTLFYGDKILGVAGVAQFWEGVGEGWVLPTATYDELFPHAKDIYKIIMVELAIIQRKYKFCRIQATVKYDSVIDRRFAEKLGFVHEGILRNYFGLGRDGIMTARLWSE